MSEHTGVVPVISLVVTRQGTVATIWAVVAEVTVAAMQRTQTLILPLGDW